MDRAGRRARWALAVAILLVPAAVLIGDRLRPGRRGRQPQPTREVVERVIDGDTLVLAGGERLRLVDVDAPELHEGKPGHPGPFPEPGAIEATAALRRLVEGRKVLVTRTGRDQYGRTLGRVHLEDGTDICAELLRLKLVRKTGG
jgi:endonuclease YncB( thermonuclease family)